MRIPRINGHLIPHSSRVFPQSLQCNFVHPTSQANVGYSDKRFCHVFEGVTQLTQKVDNSRQKRRNLGGIQLCEGLATVLSRNTR